MAAIFETLCRDAADKIRRGSLSFEPVKDWAQVHESAWESLAQINESGLLTRNSQDAIDTHTGLVKDFERCYVIGFMPLNKAEFFVDKINSQSNCVAFIQTPCNEWRRSIAVSKTTAVTKIPRYWLSTTNTPERILKLQEALHIPSALPVGLVSVFDPRWGHPAITKSNDGLFNVILYALSSRI